MKQIIEKIRPVALYSVLLNAGLYAGLHFSGILNPLVFGIINMQGDVMPAVAWAQSWQITDGFMRVRMEIFGPVILWSYVISILLFVQHRRSAVLWLLVGAFGFFVADLVLTLNHQLPINRFIEKLDFNRLTAEQTKTLGVMHRQVIKNFQSREWFSIVSFLLVALAPFLYRNRQV